MRAVAYEPCTVETVLSVYKVRLFELCLLSVSTVSHRSVSVRGTPQRSRVHQKCGHLGGMRLQGDLTSPGTRGRTWGYGPCPMAVTGDGVGNCRWKGQEPCRAEPPGAEPSLASPLPHPGLSCPTCGLNPVTSKSPLRFNAIALDFKCVWKREKLRKLLVSFKVLDVPSNSLAVQ